MKLFFSKKLLQPALAVALASAALLTGCDKGGQPPDGKLNTLGVPKESVGVVHFNLKEAQDSKVTQAFAAKIKEKIFKEEKGAEKEYTEFKTETSFDLEKDIASATFGLWFDDTKPDNFKPNGIVGVIRGKFAPDKINAYIVKKGKAKQLQVGKISFFSEKKGEVAFGFIDNQTALLVIGERSRDEKVVVARIEKALAAFSKDKAYTAPKSLLDLEKSVKKPLLLAHVEVEKSKLKGVFAQGGEQVKLFQPINAQLIAGDDGDKSKFRAIAQYDKPEKAVTVNGFALVGVAAAKDELSKKDPGLVKTFDGIKFRAEGANFIVESEQSNEEILKTLNKVLEDSSILR
jgi:hypothetical protein